jgi:hypothetical protein
MIATIARIKQGMALGSLALAMVAVSAAPMLGGHDVDAKKHKKPKAPNIAIQSITLEDHPDPGHKYVVVEVENVGTRDASGFRIGMVAANPNQQPNGGVRMEDFSLPLNLPKGQTTEVQFRLGCNWINGGAITARTDPSPVSGEPANKTANNVLSESFGAGTCS